MPRKKSDILVCPLDWGIGHATRCVPVIRILLGQGATVTIGGSGHSLEFLRQAFPELPFLHFPGIRVTYPSSGRMARKMASLGPGIARAVRNEHKALDRLIDDYGFGGVISDNRFGLWNKRVRTVYMTHQLRVRAPDGFRWIELLLARIHRSFILKYDECWIPDFPGEHNLSGELSHAVPLPGNAGFIGPLSRFYGMIPQDDAGSIPDPVDWLIMISGPEPQRSILEKAIFVQMERTGDQRIVMVRGLPGNQDPPNRQGNLMAYPHLPDHQLISLMMKAKNILCRSGYSTIMDLACLGRTAVLVPTPGQTEQEYLAKHLSSGQGFKRMLQSKLDLESFTGLHGEKKPLDLPEFDDKILETRIDQFLGKL